MPIAGLSHPAGSREMAVIDDARALRLIFSVEAEDDLHGFPPVSAFIRSVQEP
jgi:hypothetical protein